MTTETPKYLYVPATELSGKAVYRLSATPEASKIEDVRIELCYNGKSAGEFAPEHPEWSLDELSINLGKELLSAGRYATDGKRVRYYLMVKEVPSSLRLDSSALSVEDIVSDLVQNEQSHPGFVYTAPYEAEIVESIQASKENPFLYGFVCRIAV